MAKATKSKAPASEPSIRNDDAMAPRPTRRRWYAAAVLIAVVTTLAAYMQPLRPDVLHTPRLFTWNWWRSPVERNAFARIPHTTGEPHVVFALQDGRHVWAAGEGGLVLRSEDGGRTWSDTTLAIIPDDPVPIHTTAFNETSARRTSAIRLVAQKQEIPDNRSSRVQQKQETAPTGAQQKPEPNLTAPYQQGVPPNNPPDDSSNNNFATEAPAEIYRTLVTMCFADANSGWVAGNDALFRTRTGGREWERQHLAPGVLISSIACADAHTAWIAGFRGEIYTTTDGGRTWRETDNTYTNLFGSAAADARRGIIAGGNSAMQSTDGGQTWQHLNVEPAVIRDVAYLTPRVAAAAAYGKILLIDTEADTARAAMPGAGPSSDYYRIVSIGPGRAIVATRELLHKTADDFASFTTDSTFLSPSGATVRDLAFSDADRGWIANGGVHRTDDGGGTWHVQMTTGLFHDLAFSDSLNGVVVGEHGAILVTSDGGATWKPRRSGTGRRLVGVWYVGRDTVVVETGAADTLVSLNAGRSWKRATATIPRPIIQPDSSRSVMRLENGVLMRTGDAGRSWTPIAPVHTRWPAPWYYLALLLSTGVAAVPLRRRAPPVLHQSIADVLVSDRPWRPRSGDRDALGFRDLATGLTQFLANRRTNPPLTIAIIGAWGTGKTSLMNMLHHDLRRRSFYPIWFNAWHHQKEESLLAALFESIRQSGIPPIYAPRGFRFRINLLWLRLRRYTILATFVIAVFAIGLGFFLADPAARIDAVRALFTAPPSGGEWWERAGGALTLVIPAFSVVMTYLKAWRPFGRRATELVGQLRTFGAVNSRAATAGTRYAFARDFKEVADALKPHPMVIFVDDLDRCQPQQVMEVLEAINFLQTCGDVVIVMGMDRERVIGCVGFAYKDVAADLVTNLSADTNRDGILQPEEVRADFARQYLEKLVNIEVPVPAASAEGLGRVMTNRLEPDLRPELDQNAPAWLPRARKWSGVATVATLVALLVYAGTRIGSDRTDFIQAPSAAAPTSNIRDGGNAGAMVPLPDAVKSDEPARVQTSPAGTIPLAVMFLPIILLAVVFVRALRVQPETIVDDSDVFRETMELWAPLLFTRLGTPRSAKRFMNRVRLLAMLQRPPGSRPAPWLVRVARFAWAERLVRLVQRVRVATAIHASQPAEFTENAIPEDMLVSLCAVRECQPDWTDDPEMWNDFGKFLDAHRDELPAAVTGNLSYFRHWESLSNHRDRFFALTQSVRIH